MGRYRGKNYGACKIDYPVTFLFLSKRVLGWSKNSVTPAKSCRGSMLSPRTKNLGISRQWPACPTPRYKYTKGKGKRAFFGYFGD